MHVPKAGRLPAFELEDAGIRERRAQPLDKAMPSISSGSTAMISVVAWSRGPALEVFLEAARADDLHAIEHGKELAVQDTLPRTRANTCDGS